MRRFFCSESGGNERVGFSGQVVNPSRSLKPQASSLKPRRRGFTLVELLVVIAIIGVLVALLLPAVQAAREAARRMQCGNNLKQLSLALHNYHDANRRLPSGGMNSNGLSWRVSILPFVEEQTMYDNFNFNAGNWNVGTNKEGPGKLVHALVKVPAFKCPSHPIEFATNGSSALGDGRKTYNSDYHGVAGPKGNAPNGTAYKVSTTPAGNGGFAEQGVLYRDSKVRFKDCPDGLSRTLAIGEVDGISSASEFGSDGADWVRGSFTGSSGMAACRNVKDAINTLYPGPSAYNDIAFGSRHAGGAQMARADGSVNFLVEVTDVTVLMAAASRNGDESNSYDLSN